MRQKRSRNPKDVRGSTDLDHAADGDAGGPDLTWR